MIIIIHSFYESLTVWFNVPLTMISLNLSFFENSVDPNQLASEKQADQESHCFLLCL